MSGNPPKVQVDPIPSVDAVREFLLLLRRYQAACQRAFLCDADVTLCGRLDGGRQMLDNSYAAVDLLHQEVSSRLQDRRFICAFGWPDDFHVAFARLSDPERGVLRYDKQIFLRVQPDGRELFMLSEASDVIERMSLFVDAFEAAVAERTQPPAAEPTKPPDVGRTDAAVVTEGGRTNIDFAAVAARLRRERRAIRAALVEFMAEREEATAEDVAEHVHKDSSTSEKAMRSNAERTSRDLAEMRVPLAFRLVSGRMVRQILPE